MSGGGGDRASNTRLDQPVNPNDEPDTLRKAELVSKLIEYSAEHGLSKLSLRPVATAVGSSPRMLLYFFGSKEGMIREILLRTRINQQTLAKTWVEEAVDPADRIGRLWDWLTDPSNAGVERLFFESYARSLHDGDGAWKNFGAESVADWIPVIERFLTAGTGRRRSRQTKDLATYVLATMRGLLIDLLATSDLARAQNGFRVLQDHLRSLTEQSDDPAP